MNDILEEIEKFSGFENPRHLEPAGNLSDMIFFLLAGLAAKRHDSFSPGQLGRQAT